jgi:hypothetical protein
MARRGKHVSKKRGGRKGRLKIIGGKTLKGK